MPDELFRTSCSHNSAPHSDIVKHTLHFILHSVSVGAKRVPPARKHPHFGAGHKGIKPLICKHIVVYDLLPLASKNNCQEKTLDTMSEIRYDTKGDYKWKSL